MGPYIIRRILAMFVLLTLVSIVSFVIIQLPPGDIVTTIIRNLEISEGEAEAATIAALRRQYGLDRPQHMRYILWVTNFLRGDFGRSHLYNQSVRSLIGERLAFSVLISISTLIFTYAVAIPIGIYGATHQYSVGDYAASFIGFMGLATPNFLLALIMMFLGFRFFGFNMGGLFSPQFQNAPWSFARVVDLLQHLWVPIVVIGTSATAGLIRVMRATLLDELQKQYVVTARSKGLLEGRLLWRYPIRIAINPIISTIGWTLPVIVSGDTLTGIVLGLPTIGPLLLQALLAQDMYLAGAFIMLLSTLTIIGTIVSDVLLAVIDPRIRYS